MMPAVVLNEEMHVEARAQQAFRNPLRPSAPAVAEFVGNVDADSPTQQAHYSHCSPVVAARELASLHSGEESCPHPEVDQDRRGDHSIVSAAFQPALGLILTRIDVLGRQEQFSQWDSTKGKKWCREKRTAPLSNAPPSRAQQYHH